jgi:hypothetical protein
MVGTENEKVMKVVLWTLAVTGVICVVIVRNDATISLHKSSFFFEPSRDVVLINNT